MRISAVIAAFSLASCIALAQEPKPAFEVVSIRPASGQLTVRADGQRVGGAMRGGPGTDEPGRMTANYIPAFGLIEWAFRVRPDQITGPYWLQTTRYDFIATVPPGSTREQVPLMFQGMLEDRFGLKVHHVTKEFAAYNLVIAKGGLKLKDSIPTDPCSLGLAGGCQKTIYPAGIAHSVSTEPIAGTRPQGAVRHLGGRGEPLTTLASLVQIQLGGSLVVDKTGLEGNYDFRLDFAAPNAPSDDDTPYPSIFTALEKDLGLKLESTKMSQDTIVIDHIARPSEN